MKFSSNLKTTQAICECKNCSQLIARRIEMDIQMTDVLVHIDETLEEQDLDNVENRLRDEDGVISVHHESKHPHLMLVEYNPDRTSSRGILQTVTRQGLHAELVGL